MDKEQSLLCLPNALIFRTLHLAHAIYLCVSHDSQNKVIISVRCINHLIFVMEILCYLCEVGTEFIWTVEVRFSL
jgi:hypothetical protein